MVDSWQVLGEIRDERSRAQQEHREPLGMYLTAEEFAVLREAYFQWTADPEEAVPADPKPGQRIRIMGVPIQVLPARHEAEA